MPAEIPGLERALEKSREMERMKRTVIKLNEQVAKLEKRVKTLEKKK